MDVAWERSELKHIAAAHTPTLIRYEKHFPKPGDEGRDQRSAVDREL